PWLKEEVRHQLLFAHAGLQVAGKIGHTGASQHLVVQEEAAGHLAAWLRQDPIRRVGHDRGAASLLASVRTGDQPDRLGIDGGARPYRVDGDATRTKLL